MDYIKELINVGDDVLYTVTSAIEENDYSGLSEELKERFRIFEEDVREDISMRTGGAVPGRKEGPGKRYGAAPYAGRRAPRRVTREVPSGQRTDRPRSGNPQGQSAVYGRPPSGYGTQRQRTPFRARFFGKGTAIAKFVTGIIGMVCLVPSLAASFAMTLIGTTGGLAAFLTLLPFTAGSVWLTVTGNRRRKLVDVYNRFARLIGPAEYISIEELATRAGTSEEDAVAQLEKLMKNNMLPQGRFDRNQTTLMLTPRVWKQYQAAEEYRQQRELEERLNAEEAAVSPDRSEENSILREGNAFVEKVHHYNDLIPNEEMSEKLYRLEHIMQKIFRQLEKEPGSASDLHKLMDYYLPTVDKLLQAYTDLDVHPAGSENIDRTRREIEEAVDTVNVAFENLFNDLFQDTAWDISSDISVMKTMMQQDGLMNNTPSGQKESV